MKLAHAKLSLRKHECHHTIAEEVSSFMLRSLHQGKSLFSSVSLLYRFVDDQTGKRLVRGSWLSLEKSEA